MSEAASEITWMSHVLKSSNRTQKPNTEPNTKSQWSDSQMQDKTIEAKAVKEAKAKGDSTASSIQTQNRFGVLSVIDDATDV